LKISFLIQALEFALYITGRVEILIPENARGFKDLPITRGLSLSVPDALVASKIVI
jgi:hypothetical protein